MERVWRPAAGLESSPTIILMAMHPRLLQPLAFLFALSAFAADPQLSRPVRAWEFLDATGPRAGLLGTEDGTLEAYVYPLKIFGGLKLRFVAGAQIIPGEAIARRISARSGSYTITYTGDDFQVDETLVAPIDEPGAAILLDVRARNPLRIDVEFVRDFQLMWPASIGTGYAEWNDRLKSFQFGADGQPYAAVFGSPDAGLESREYATNYSAATHAAFTLGEITGHAQRVLAVAASMKSRDEAQAAYNRLIARGGQLVDETERYYRDYLANTIALSLPDAHLQQAYDWSRISVVKGFVDNPFLGRGLVAGYGPSKGAYRPGFAWFFGRDSFWTSFALISAGDFANARAAIQFISHFQRDDGKIPHEISQSASLVDWFKQFPYGFASADATPLYAIATADYVRASGDAAFAREQAARLWKALAFMRSTLDEAGFPRNLHVGHGWVEGGPLLPIRVELYQAGCYVEALRSLAMLARVLNDDRRAQDLDAEFAQQRRALEEKFWLPGHRYAFALGTGGQPVDQPSVLATVPMWFDLLDRQHAQEMIGLLAGEPFAADWGTRIISSQSALYDPSGYHFGSVWPLFTGWAAVGEYRNHAAEPALANLRANAWLALDGAGGHTTEVLSGDSYSPLSTASPHQIWSAAMVVSPLLRGLLGLDTDAAGRKIVFAPHLPADWQTAGVHGIPLPGARVNLDILRDAGTLRLTIANSGAEAVHLEFAPAYPLCAHLDSATLDGQPVTWKTDSEYLDWHPRFEIAAPAGTSTLTIRHHGLFGYALPFSPPRLAERSMSLKIVSERWADNGHQLALTVSGRPSRDYRLELVNGDLLASVDGATREGPAGLIVHIPAGTTDEYVDRQITFVLR
jgi:glycogen debranching enzyme